LAGTGTGAYYGDNVPASTAEINNPKQLAVDTKNNALYFADSSNSAIRMVNLTSHYITTIAGGLFGDNGPATQATLFGPYSIAIDSVRRLLYFSDFYNNRIRVINLITNIISTVAGSGVRGYNGDGAALSTQLANPTGIALDIPNNGLYITDSNNNRVRLLNITLGTVVTITGGSSSGLSGDNGPAASATLNNPYGVALDLINNKIYIAGKKH
jgi:DNA-binding beta-propeller fold protein YncE